MNDELQPAPWLATAKLQARRLSDARLHAPLRALAPRGRASVVWPRLCATVATLALLLGSAAWATLRQPVVEEPVPVRSVRVAPSVHRSATPTVVDLPAEVASAVKKRRLQAHKVPPAITPTVAPTNGTVKFEDEGPDGDVIVGRVPPKHAPLFTTEEYKSRGVLVR